MKTAKEWFQLLPEPVQTQAIANIDPNFSPVDQKYPDIHSAIDSAFSWQDSYEGSSYWQVIAKLSYFGEIDNPTEAVTAFINYIQKNTDVWVAFESKALQMAKTRDHYGAKAIMEVIRYETTLKDRNSEFKINNTIVSCLARIFMIIYPEYEGFFKVRPSKFDQVNSAA